jgi:hypothetical protein
MTLTELITEARAVDWDFAHWCYANGHDASDPDARNMFERLLAYARREGRPGFALTGRFADSSRCAFKKIGRFVRPSSRGSSCPTARLQNSFLVCELIKHVNVCFTSWLRKNVLERSKAASDWLASSLKRANWHFLRSRGLETVLKLPEVILSDLETPRQPAAQARIAARNGFTPTMFIARVRL